VLDLGQDALRLYPVQGEVEVLGTSPLGAEDPAFVVV
jgi:hypothetical protein